MTRLLLALLLVLAGCSGDDNNKTDNSNTNGTNNVDPFKEAEAAAQEWAEYVSTHNSCEAAEDCVVISTGCEISCWDAVSAEYESEAQAEADAARERAFEANQDCAACGEAGEPTCEAGMCTLP